MAPLGYHAMRMRWCRAGLVAFLRRWGVYFAVATAVIGAGASGGVDAVRAVAVWTVLPLLTAVREGGVRAVSAIALQIAIGGLLVRGLRELLWPFRWRLAERALPLQPRQLLLSDLRVVGWVLLPVFGVYAVGAQALLQHDRDPLHPGMAAALAALTIVGAGTWLVGVAAVQQLRRLGAARMSRRGSVIDGGIVAPVRDGLTTARSSSLRLWPIALLILPLWRGPARRSGGTLLVGVLLFAAAASGIALTPSATPWYLAAHALLAMLLTTRLRRLLAVDLAPLVEAALQLPISRRSIRVGIAKLVLAPVVASVAFLAAGLPWRDVRPWVVASYGVALLICAAVEAGSTSADAIGESSRWLLSLVLLVALASEVVA